ncbi:Gfo/Idh/MocA family protein [Lederbergia wuyishanensis]|uniref:Dehydrogenase n=1 Tax=Lederbergia wuyishanensis TaxID=1347903 RepID=A0ABU0D0A1_9BACI|nr:Gfo/Idh/MocA family oxidoreductase [Lederbergia wuyishanensis]MCJ8006461.1 Gfo/Idh/MocA family oxidoreductase [Lederbergia wuyishanensis]MDQ0341837.1 putative dehydrogenase [Lederbergia wuyishanensis]
MIKVAVVGVNHIGKLHCRYYQENPNSQLVAVCDLNKELAEKVAASYGISAYSDIKMMLKSEEIDVVSVATGGFENGSHHYEPAMIAMDFGKDVLVEKPISNNISEAREMVDFAKKQKVRLACNLNHRYVPTAYKAKEWIDNGDLGSLLFINMKLTIRNPNETSPWIHLRALHPHSIDVMRYFCGDIKRVQAFMTKAPGRTVWSTASINMEFFSGVVGHLTGSYDMDNRHPIEFCEVAGTEGRFIINDVYNEMTFFPHNNSELRVYRNSVLSGINGFNETFKNRINTFLQEIKDQVSPDDISGSGIDALAAQEVIEAIILSQKENGKVIEVNKIKEEGKQLL